MSNDNTVEPMFSDPQERQRLMRMHPLMRDKQLLPTPQIKSTFQQIAAGLLHRIPSLSWEGPPRHGKTQTAVACVRMLRAVYPDVPVFFTIASGHDENVHTERLQWGELLHDFKHPGAGEHRTQQAMFNILSLIRTACDAVGGDQAVLIVDEAQNWDLPQWAHIKNITNKLAHFELHPINLLVVSFAQDDFAHIRMKVEAKKLDLNGRFFLDSARFRGLRTSAELADFLNSFDDPALADYPIGSKVSYTHFLYPMAFAAGWRLAKEAELIWKAIVADWSVSSRKSAPDIGMAAIVSVLKWFLFAHVANDAPDFRGTAKEWVTAVKSSHFRKFQGNGAK